MKHKRWAALGLALFGFSLLGNSTTAVAASKLSSLRTEVSQLKTQRDTYRPGDDDGTGHGHSSGLSVDFMDRPRLGT